MKNKIQRKRHIEYAIQMTWSPEAKVYVVRIPELPGCSTHGSTQEEALEMAKEAIAGYIESLQKNNEPIPQPLSLQKKPKAFQLRINPNLYQSASFTADNEGISLNKWIESSIEEKLHSPPRKTG